MRTTVVVGALIAIVATAAEAEATPGQCQRTIIREARTFNRAAMSVRQRCEEPLLSGHPVDCSPTDPIVQLKLAPVEGKFRRRVEAQCHHETLASIGWNIPACPDLEGSGCNGPIADIGDVEDCIVCVGNAAVTEGLSLYYGALNVPTSGKLRACQLEIGRAAGSFYSNKVKAMGRCELRDLSGDIMGPCPGDPTTNKKIDMLTLRLNRLLCSRCGGSDLCGGSNDQTPSDIGFAMSCPAVTIPGGISCSGAINTLTDLEACVACVTEYKVDCVDALAAPTVKPYPPECN